MLYSTWYRRASTSPCELYTLLFTICCTIHGTDGPVHLLVHSILYCSLYAVQYTYSTDGPVHLIVHSILYCSIYAVQYTVQTGQYISLYTLYSTVHYIYAVVVQMNHENKENKIGDTLPFNIGMHTCTMHMHMYDIYV